MPEHKPPVLYLSYDGLTDPLGQSQILPYLQGLSAKGYAITVISAEKRENFTKRNALISRAVAAMAIDWQPVFYTKKPPVLSTLWDLSRMYRSATYLHKQKPFVMVHCRSYLTALIGSRLKRKYRLKFIFDMRGFWADERIEGGLWRLQHPVYKRVYAFFKQKEQQFLQQADYTISLTHEAKQIIQQWPGLGNIPIQVIPCCVDMDLFAKSDKHHTVRMPHQPEQYRDDTCQQGSGINGPDEHHPVTVLSQQAVGSSRPYTLSYLGSIGTWYMLDEMLLFFKRLLLQRPEARFLFITPDHPQIITQQANALGIPQERIEVRAAERQEVPKFLAECQFSMFFIKPCFSKKASSPTKMGEILAMGLPVICNAGVGDTDYIIEKYKAGAIVHDFTEEQFDEAIAQLDGLAQLPPEHFRQAALAYFDLQKGVELYEEVYRSVWP